MSMKHIHIKANPNESYHIHRKRQKSSGSWLTYFIVGLVLLSVMPTWLVVLIIVGGIASVVKA